MNLNRKKEVYDLVEGHYREHFGSTVKKMSRKCGGRHNAEDVIQEAYARCLQYWDSFRVMEGKTFDTWFNTIMFNCFKQFKKQERSPLSFDNEERSQDPVYNNDLVDGVKQAIKLKPDNEKYILSLFFLEEYKPRDIDPLVLESPSAIRKIISRFKKEMKRTLSDE